MNAEIVVVLGWGRSILLQLAHPLVAAGVGEHSHFRAGARGFAQRAHGTIGAMLGVTFGTHEEARRVAARINRIHDRVNGQLASPVGPHSAGAAYSARDPQLLCWVHATLIDSMIRSYEAFVGPLSDDEKNRYAADAVWLLRELGVPEEQLLDSTASIDNFLRSSYSSGTICVGDQARRLADDLLKPPLAIAAPLFRLTRLITIGMLPPEIRAQYGFDWSPRQQRRYEHAVTFVRRARALTPRFAREWPHARRARARRAATRIEAPSEDLFSPPAALARNTPGETRGRDQAQ